MSIDLLNKLFSGVEETYFAHYAAYVQTLGFEMRLIVSIGQYFVKVWTHLLVVTAEIFKNQDPDLLDT